MKPDITVLDYAPQYQPSIRRILAKIGWAEQYASAAQQNVQNLAKDKENYGVYVGTLGYIAVGFLYVQYYAWNQLCQIHGLAVDPDF